MSSSRMSVKFSLFLSALVLLPRSSNSHCKKEVSTYILFVYRYIDPSLTIVFSSEIFWGFPQAVFHIYSILVSICRHIYYFSRLSCITGACFITSVAFSMCSLNLDIQTYHWCFHHDFSTSGCLFSIVIYRFEDNLVCPVAQF